MRNFPALKYQTSLIVFLSRHYNVWHRKKKEQSAGDFRTSAYAIFSDSGSYPVFMAKSSQQIDLRRGEYQIFEHRQA